MENLILGSDMKNVDTYTINQIGIPSLVLMERAAYCVYEEVISRFDKRCRLLILCGTGNNGADGLALSRMLHLAGYMPDIYILGNKDNATEEFKKQYKIITNIQVNIVEELYTKEYTVIIDSIFGIGIKREVKDIYYDCIEEINNLSAFKIAIDIPSGLCSDTGKIFGIALKVDITITFGAKKVGLLINKGKDYSGEVILKDIGFPAVAYTHSKKYFSYDQDDLSLIPKRIENSNKGTYGKLLVIAGSKNMAGAAFLTSKAAYRMGVGLVQIISVNENREILQTCIPEAVLITYDSATPDFEMIQKYMKESSAIVIGPGLGINDTTKELVKRVLESHKKTVIDADALNVIAQHNELCDYYHQEVTITPHLGEMSRLTGLSVNDIKNSLIDVCNSYANKHGINCVLKDSNSIFSNGRETFINIVGNSGMASAGSGDVLAGIIGALLAQTVPSSKAGSLGSFVHGFAGDIMANKIGKSALMATDIIEGLISISERINNG